MRPLRCICAGVIALAAPAAAEESVKTESFDADPGWQGVNNRTARTETPVSIRQDFGYAKSNRAGGARGEIGGHVTPAGEAAFYGKTIAPRTFRDALSASGVVSVPDGAFNLLVGFFNADTVNEWRTPNTLAIRLNGRGDHFFAYVEYCTSQWRAGGDTTPFPSKADPQTGRLGLIGFPSGGRAYKWTLSYDPAANNGGGNITATIDDSKAACLLDVGHQADGATFNRFGILNVIKSADGGGEVYFDNITVNGELEEFDQDPRWDGRNNRRTYNSRLVRPRFDFGFSPTAFAGGKATGELGGMIFRGDCRFPHSLAAYGDAVGPLTLEGPIRASGRIVMTRGVTDSTVLFGFFNSRDSLRQNESQANSVPESVLGIHVEGPSRDGFCFYPVLRPQGAGGQAGLTADSPRLQPNGASHAWSLVYDPAGAGGKGRITVTLDAASTVLDLEDGVKRRGTRFDRFGIVTSWIDGNSQDVYWDDVTYTVRQ